MREFLLTGGRGAITTCQEVVLDKSGIVEVAILGGNNQGLALGCIRAVVEMSHQCSGFDTAEVYSGNVDTDRIIGGETVCIHRYLR